MRTVLLSALLVLLAVGPAAMADTANHPVQAGRTGKERLSDKGSDEQRVNDCKVPQSRRTRVRPTDCTELH